MSNYYLYLNNQQTGPYTEDQLQQMLAGGEVPAECHAWKEGTPDWVPLNAMQWSKPQLKLKQAIPPSVAAPPVRTDQARIQESRAVAMASVPLGFMGRLSNSWTLMGASFRVLKANKSMLLLPLISSASAVLVLVSFAIPALLFFNSHPGALKETSQHGTVFNALHLTYVFAFYFCNYAVIIFFNAALVACASAQMQGQTCSMSEGLKTAASRLPAILGWAAIAATVGLILHLIESAMRDKKMAFLANIVTGLLGAAWTIITFLVLPVLVIERVGPITALKSSISMIKKTWGEQLIGNAGFGIAFTILCIPGIILIFLGITLGAGSQSMLTGGLLVGAGVVYFMLMALAQSAMRVIYQTALYFYARDGVTPDGFSETSLAGAFATKS